MLEAATGATSELVPVTVAGDNHTVPLGQGRPGVFTSALQQVLLAGTVDYVVHSFKDLPSALVEGLAIAAVPERANPCDVLVLPDELAADLGILAEGTHPGQAAHAALRALPAAVRIGTSSPRRAAAILRLRPDVVIVPIRGNVETRVNRALSRDGVDAVVMAAAGLERAGLLNPAWPVFTLDEMVPAPAQGALAIECRSDDAALVELLARLNHPQTCAEITAERAVLTGVNAACTTAVGALASTHESTLTLTADLTDHAGVEYARATAQCEIQPCDPAQRHLEQACDLGASLAATLLEAAV
jgi:hydroxymethylbilane synthase